MDAFIHRFKARRVDFRSQLKKRLTSAFQGLGKLDLPKWQLKVEQTVNKQINAVAAHKTHLIPFREVPKAGLIFVRACCDCALDSAGHQQLDEHSPVPEALRIQRKKRRREESDQEEEEEEEEIRSPPPSPSPVPVPTVIRAAAPILPPTTQVATPAHQVTTPARQAGASRHASPPMATPTSTLRRAAVKHSGGVRTKMVASSPPPAGHEEDEE